MCIALDMYIYIYINMYIYIYIYVCTFLLYVGICFQKIAKKRLAAEAGPINKYVGWLLHGPTFVR